MTSQSDSSDEYPLQNVIHISQHCLIAFHTNTAVVNKKQWRRGRGEAKGAFPNFPKTDSLNFGGGGKAAAAPPPKKKFRLLENRSVVGKVWFKNAKFDAKKLPFWKHLEAKL